MSNITIELLDYVYDGSSIDWDTDGTNLDLQMSKISRSEYLNIPTKTTEARPTQFFG